MAPITFARQGAPRLPRRESGVVLLIALIALVAMTLAGIGMMRALDTGTLVAGNIGFRQSAVATGDSGIEAARKWLIDNSKLLENDDTTKGYYATRQDKVDFTGNKGGDPVDWGGTNPTALVKAFHAGDVDGSGNDVYYVINRLCSAPGSVNGLNQNCATSAQGISVGSTQDAPDYSNYALKEASSIYYRITARVNGAKNTVSYVQAIVQI